MSAHQLPVVSHPPTLPGPRHWISRCCRVHGAERGQDDLRVNSRCLRSATIVRGGVIPFSPLGGNNGAWDNANKLFVHPFVLSEVEDNCWCICTILFESSSHVKKRRRRELKWTEDHYKKARNIWQTFGMAQAKIMCIRFLFPRIELLGGKQERRVDIYCPTSLSTYMRAVVGCTKDRRSLVSW
jgi:hypothetical protein